MGSDRQGILLEGQTIRARVWFRLSFVPSRAVTFSPMGLDDGGSTDTRTDSLLKRQ